MLLKPVLIGTSAARDPIAKEVMFFSAPQSEISHLTDIYLDSKSDMPMNSNETTQWSDIWDD